MYFNHTDYKCNSWYVTILDDEITFYSNGHYLDVSKDNENIETCDFMKRWNFKKKDEFYYFIYPGKENNNILSMEEGKPKVNKENIGDTELFKLIDILEEEEEKYLK